MAAKEEYPIVYKDQMFLNLPYSSDNQRHLEHCNTLFLRFADKSDSLDTFFSVESRLETPLFDGV